jgi:cysteine-rich repeat protein
MSRDSRRRRGAATALFAAFALAASCGGEDPAAVCGNGQVESGEECDDGNLLAGDGCEADCTRTCKAAADCDDGDPCTADACDLAAGCSHTPLPTWYEDLDGDGYGNPGSPVCAATQPAGFVADATDCCDTSADTHPGQTGWFGAANACGDFDYDCSGAEVKQFMAVSSGSCAGGYTCSAITPGFGGSPPPCGFAATWYAGCHSVSCGTLCYTCQLSSYTQLQGCH